MFEKKKSKNRADLLQALRGYRCGMVREQDKRIKTGIWGFWQATEGSGSLVPKKSKDGKPKDMEAEIRGYP